MVMSASKLAVHVSWVCACVVACICTRVDYGMLHISKCIDSFYIMQASRGDIALSSSLPALSLSLSLPLPPFLPPSFSLSLSLPLSVSLYLCLSVSLSLSIS